jgi:O-acetyl-ADP-ribose deacetylase (regulator of RNase III)/uncharacterized protein YwgA
MVKVLIGNLLDSKAQTLVNTVNCVGVMGKGIALEFKKRFPEMFEDYAARCQRWDVRLGRPYLYKRLFPPWILNFPTKDHWRSVAKLEDITRGLEYLVAHYEAWGITSLAVPPLGCGQGQLEWRVVGPTIYRYLSRLKISVELYAPFGTPHEELQVEFLSSASESAPPVQRVKPSWIGLVEILRRVEQQPYHWPVGRTTFQKIAFVATEEGLPTGLLHQRGSYGPFSPEVKSLVTRLVNNGLVREERLGRMLVLRSGPTYDDARRAFANDLAQWEPIIEKVTDLFMRMNTERAEVVATVLFVARRLAEERKERPSERDVVDAVMAWKQRRRPALDRTVVASTVRNLAALRWLNVQASEDLPFPEAAALEVST